MDYSNLTIVCYTGGTCGDLVSAIIDPSDAKFNSTLKTVLHNTNRIQLKKPHLFGSNQEKDQYLHDMSKLYSSIPSHDLDYHIQQKHKFVSITVEDFDVALWAARRFKNCHRPHVWEEMQKVCNVNNIEEYAQVLMDFSKLVSQHTDRIVKLEDVKNGNVINSLEAILGYSLPKNNKNLYSNWLSMQQNQFII